MLRWRALAGLVGMAMVVGAGSAAGRAAIGGSSGRNPDPRGGTVLEISYTAPVLVRAGQRVTILKGSETLIHTWTRRSRRMRRCCSPSST